MDRIKDFMEENKLKIILSLLIVIVGLMITLFVVMGQHNDDQTMSNQARVLNSNRNVQQSSQFSRSNNHYQSQFIDVEGAVKRPGVYQFTNNMRVDDAVNLAEGLNPSADRQHINLAKKLVDQQTVYIPVKGEVKGLPGSSSESNESDSQTNSTGSNENSGKINLNDADAKRLQSINGIGEKRAEKIVDYRKEHGNFKQVTDVKKISGIGDKFFGNIKDHVTV